MDHKLSDKEFLRVRELITNSIGLHFPIEGWEILRLRLTSAAEEFGFQDLTGFVQWLLSTELNKDQINLLASHITIPETYFWREPKVFTALTDTILPELIKTKANREKSINIWSAGCSTGEEAYSIAIAIRRTIPDLNEWKINITATDINPKTIEKAKTGIYDSWSFRNTPDWLKATYFHHRKEKKFEIVPEIKRMVTFSVFNLTHDNYLSAICRNQKMDIIFCRNVLMYFTKTWAAKVSQNLYNILSDEGWLVVSSCELSSDLYPQYTMVNFPGAILYRKSNDDLKDPGAHLQGSHSKLFLNALSPNVADKKEGRRLSIFAGSDGSSPEENINNRQPVQIQPVNISMNSFQEPELSEDTSENILNKNKKIIRLLASQGQLEEALIFCNKSIASEKLAHSLYFLRASILQEMDKTNEAIGSLKQAIFIDPNYVMGHFTIGNLYKQLGNTISARRHFSIALELLNMISKDDIPAETEDLSANFIRGIILANLPTQNTL